MNTKLKPFDLEAALRGEPVVTRDGRPVTQVTKFDVTSIFRIVGVVNSKVEYWTENGYYHPDYSGNSSDLFMVTKTVKKEGWVNLYKSDDEEIAVFTGHGHNTKEAAEEEASPKCIATVKIEWEEEI